MRTTILGHVQRGGVPTAFDRLLATRFGNAATELLAEGKHGVLVGLICGEVRTTPLKEVVSSHKKLDLSMLDLAKVLSK
jgi:6-phosphofructokinase 1